MLALDPGQCTGYAIARQTSERFEVCYDEAFLDPNQFWAFLQQVLCSGDAYVICESFEFRQGKQHKGIDLYPRELIGILRLYMWYNSDRLYFQTPVEQSDKKAYFSDAKLKELGLYQKGLDHGRSAVKHLLQWYAFYAGFKFLDHPDQLPELVDIDWFVDTYIRGGDILTAPPTEAPS